MCDQPERYPDLYPHEINSIIEQKANREWKREAERLDELRIKHEEEIEALKAELLDKPTEWDKMVLTESQRQVSQLHDQLLTATKELREQDKRIRELVDYHGCAFSGPGRGDCEHATGFVGVSVPDQHDGPDDTVDVFGRPNGVCWWCWHKKQIEDTQRERDIYKQALDDLGVTPDEAKAGVVRSRKLRVSFSEYWKWDKWWSGMVIIKEQGNPDSPIVSTKSIAEEAYNAGYVAGGGE